MATLEELDFRLNNLDAQVSGLRARIYNGELGNLVARDITTVDVTNTITETDLFSVTVTGGMLRSDRCLLPIGTGDYLNNTGVNKNLTLRLKLGATTLATAGPSAVTATGATRAFFQPSFFIANTATAAQVGFLSGAPTAALAMYTAAVDTSESQTLKLTAQWAEANANLSLRLFYVVVQLF